MSVAGHWLLRLLLVLPFHAYMETAAMTAEGQPVNCRFLALDKKPDSVVWILEENQPVRLPVEPERPSAAVEFPSLGALQLSLEREDGQRVPFRIRVQRRTQGGRDWLVLIDRASTDPVAYCVQDPLYLAAEAGVWIFNRSGCPLVVGLDSQLQPITQLYSELKSTMLTPQRSQQLAIYLDQGDGWQTGLSAEFLAGNGQKWLLLIDSGHRIGAPIRVRRIYLNDRKATCQRSAAGA